MQIAAPTKIASVKPKMPAQIQLFCSALVHCTSLQKFALFLLDILAKRRKFSKSFYNISTTVLVASILELS